MTETQSTITTQNSKSTALMRFGKSKQCTLSVPVILHLSTCHVFLLIYHMIKESTVIGYLPVRHIIC